MAEMNHTPAEEEARMKSDWWWVARAIERAAAQGNEPQKAEDKDRCR